MKRQPAWRIFASEYNDSKVELKGEGEMTPSYVVTPLGAKVNRIFIIGVITDIENVSEGGEFVRAHISDPTGVFTLYSGQYQQEITDALTNIEVPAFVAVVGKTRTYIPEEGGDLYTSIRPERIIEVDADIRDQWILETCKNTKDRIEAFIEANKMEDPNIRDLIKLGYSTNLAEGLITALNRYENVELSKYINLIKESLEYLISDREGLTDFIEKDKKIINKEDKKSLKEKIDAATEEKEKIEEIETIVLKVIKENEDEEGTSWDLVTKKCAKTGIDNDTIEEALTSLMDKGLIYEPFLGTIKTT
jgi:RPA family protein